MAQKSVIVSGGEDALRREYTASGAFNPTYLLGRDSAGKVKAHATAEGNQVPHFALENDIVGKDIDDAYASGDRVQTVFPRRGDIVRATLKDGETVVIGTLVESAGDGTLQAHAADYGSSAGPITVVPNSIVGEAASALDLSGSSGADPTDHTFHVLIW